MWSLGVSLVSCVLLSSRRWSSSLFSLRAGAGAGGSFVRRFASPICFAGFDPRRRSALLISFCAVGARRRSALSILVASLRRRSALLIRALNPRRRSARFCSWLAGSCCRSAVLLPCLVASGHRWGAAVASRLAPAASLLPVPAPASLRALLLFASPRFALLSVSVSSSLPGCRSPVDPCSSGLVGAVSGCRLVVRLVGALCCFVGVVALGSRGGSFAVVLAGCLRRRWFVLLPGDGL